MYLRKGPTIEVNSPILNLLFQTWIHFYFLFTILHISLSKYLTELEKLLTEKFKKFLFSEYKKIDYAEIYKSV